MAEIILIRHGQASFGVDNYDQLSELGRKQVVWLGEYLNGLGRHCDRLLMGEMERHRETADGVLKGLQSNLASETHPGLDEYNFQGLLTRLRENSPDQWVETGHARKDYYHNMRRALAYWMDGVIDTDGRDTWEGFCARITDALEFLLHGECKRILAVTSGGPIAVLIGRILGLTNQRICDLALQIKNSSTNTFLYNRVNMTLDSFNDVGHLQTPTRNRFITFS